jgi:hypothetical protein
LDDHKRGTVRVPTTSGTTLVPARNRFLSCSYAAATRRWQARHRPMSTTPTRLRVEPRAPVAYVAAAAAMAPDAGTRDARWPGPPGGMMPVVGSDEQCGHRPRVLVNGIAMEAAR